MNYKKNLHSEIIKKSHIRSLTYGIEKDRVVSKKILRGRDCVMNIRKNEKLIKAAVPMMNILQEILQGSEDRKSVV